MKSDEKLVIQIKRTKHWEILFRNADSSMVGRRRNWGGAPELQGNMWVVLREASVSLQFKRYMILKRL